MVRVVMLVSQKCPKHVSYYATPHIHSIHSKEHYLILELFAEKDN